MTKIIKNNKRNTLPKYTPYVPNYKTLGLEPTISSDPNPFKGAKVPVIVNGTVNKKIEPVMQRNPKTNVPYAEIPPPKEYNVVMPNVGNNVERVWNSVDNIIDDVEFDLDESIEMIDNNDQISEYAFDNTQLQPMEQTNNDIANVDLQENEYLLAIDGSIISTGTLETIQQEAKELILGEHKLYNTQQIPIEHIVVLKRVNIKVGVFVEE